MKGRFEGIIQKVNEPKYSEKYGVWSISLKENGKWTSVWRKDQSKADELYRLLVKRMKSNGLGIDLKPTTLSQKQLEISQLCFNRLEANEFLKMDDDSTATKMLSAVDFFIQHYYEHEVPKVKDVVQMFLEKQEQRNLSEFTLRDYRNVLSLFVVEYAEARISMIKPMDCKKFVRKRLVQTIESTVKYISKPSLSSVVAKIIPTAKTKPGCVRIPLIGNYRRSKQMKSPASPMMTS